MDEKEIIQENTEQTSSSSTEREPFQLYGKNGRHEDCKDRELFDNICWSIHRLKDFADGLQDSDPEIFLKQLKKSEVLYGEDFGGVSKKEKMLEMHFGINLIRVRKVFTFNDFALVTALIRMESGAEFLRTYQMVKYGEEYFFHKPYSNVELSSDILKSLYKREKPNIEWEG